MMSESILSSIYQDVLKGVHSEKLPAEMREQLDLIIEHSEKAKGVLAVLMTLLLKKVTSPRQDIRLHQAGMKGGFSGRVLDTKTVTPFLLKHNFPAMKSGSGWLTRSLEQPHPYDKEYPGKIQPAELKESFLEVINTIQCQNLAVEPVLHYLFSGLIRQRDEQTNIRLSRPHNLSIEEIVARLNAHFTSHEKGTSRLPVLAVYAVYQQLVKEIERYKSCRLLDLESHTSADQKTGLLGDIQIVSRDNQPIEAVEIKHNIRLTPELVMACYRKFRKTPVKTFYLLSTDGRLAHTKEIKKIVTDIRRNHGCHTLVNGVSESIAYYLRLLKDTSLFIDAYVSLVEQDNDIPYALKRRWEELNEG